MAERRPKLLLPVHEGPLIQGLMDALGRDMAHDVYEKAVRRIGEEPFDMLGRGGWGIAYRLPSGRVLKVTRDWDELDAAAALQAAGHPNVVGIHDVFLVGADRDAVAFVVRDAVEATIEEFDPGASAAIEAASDLADEAYQRELRVSGDRRQAAQRAQVEFLMMLADEAQQTGNPLLWDIVEAVRHMRALSLHGFGLRGRNVGVLGTDREPRAVVFDFGRLVREPREFALLGAAEPPEKPVVFAGRWQIAWGDFAGARHTQVFFREVDAKRRMKTLLSDLMDRLESHWKMEKMVGARGNELRAWYIKEAPLYIAKIQELLQKDDVWNAYEEWRNLEDAYAETMEETKVPGFPLSVAVGWVFVGGPER